MKSISLFASLNFKNAPRYIILMTDCRFVSRLLTQEHMLEAIRCLGSMNLEKINEMIKDIKWLEMIAFSSIIGMSSFD